MHWERYMEHPRQGIHTRTLRIKLSWHLTSWFLCPLRVWRFRWERWARSKQAHWKRHWKKSTGVTRGRCSRWTGGPCSSTMRGGGHCLADAVVLCFLVMHKKHLLWWLIHQQQIIFLISSMKATGNCSQAATQCMVKAMISCNGKTYYLANSIGNMRFNSERRDLFLMKQ